MKLKRYRSTIGLSDSQAFAEAKNGEWMKTSDVKQLAEEVLPYLRTIKQYIPQLRQDNLLSVVAKLEKLKGE